MNCWSQANCTFPAKERTERCTSRFLHPSFLHFNTVETRHYLHAPSLLAAVPFQASKQASTQTCNIEQSSNAVARWYSDSERRRSKPGSSSQRRQPPSLAPPPPDSHAYRMVLHLGRQTAFMTRILQHRPVRSSMATMCPSRSSIWPGYLSMFSASRSSRQRRLVQVRHRHLRSA